MNATAGRRSRPITIAAIVALIFGGLTVAAGGRALFGPVSVQAELGDFVPFVLWFNFVAGFAYVLCGMALWKQRRWAVWFAVTIAASTLLVACGFVAHMAFGGAFEVRTAAALVLRIAIWSGISIVALRHIRAQPHPLQQ